VTLLVLLFGASGIDFHSALTGPWAAVAMLAVALGWLAWTVPRWVIMAALPTEEREPPSAVSGDAGGVGTFVLLLFVFGQLGLTIAVLLWWGWCAFRLLRRLLNLDW
jgi:hypothetical protein